MHPARQYTYSGLRTGGPGGPYRVVNSLRRACKGRCFRGVCSLSRIINRRALEELMTMIAGVRFRTFGVLAYDSRARIEHGGGRVEYEDAGMPFRAIPGGFIGAAGHGEICYAAAAYLPQTPPGDLRAQVARLRPLLDERVATVGKRFLRKDPAEAQILIVTTGASGVELGRLKGSGSLRRVPSPGTAVVAPSGTDRDSVLEQFESVEKRVRACARDQSTAYDLLRSLGRFYAEVSTWTPCLSGQVRLGMVQKRPDGGWQTAALATDATAVAEATDPDLTALFEPTAGVPA